MELIGMAGKPVIFTRPTSTVQEVSEQMAKDRVGAVVVLDEGRLVGILSERDIVRRAAAQRRDLATTLVSEVMTSPVQTVTVTGTAREALERMHRGGFRHLPLLDAQGNLLGMLSVRDLLRERLEELDRKNAELVSFMSADALGG